MARRFPARRFRRRGVSARRGVDLREWCEHPRRERGPRRRLPVDRAVSRDQREGHDGEHGVVDGVTSTELTHPTCEGVADDVQVKHEHPADHEERDKRRVAQHNGRQWVGVRDEGARQAEGEHRKDEHEDAAHPAIRVDLPKTRQERGERRGERR